MTHISYARFRPVRTILAGIVLVLSGVLAFPGTGEADTLTCESENNHYNHCYADTRGGVTLQTQLSHTSCYQGNSWGYDNKGVWVSNGCRAVFRVGSTHHAQSDKSDNAAAAVAGIALLALGAAAAHERHEDDHYEYDYNSQHYSDHHRNSYVD